MCGKRRSDHQLPFFVSNGFMASLNRLPQRQEALSKRRTLRAPLEFGIARVASRGAMPSSMAAGSGSHRTRDRSTTNGGLNDRARLIATKDPFFVSRSPLSLLYDRCDVADEDSFQMKVMYKEKRARRRRNTTRFDESAGRILKRTCSRKKSERTEHHLASHRICYSKPEPRAPLQLPAS